MPSLPARFRSPRYWIRLLLFAIFSIYVAWTIGLAAFALITSARSARRPLGKTTPSDWGLIYEAVTFSGYDGARLAGWYIPAQPGAAAVILLHGYAGTRLSNAAYIKMLAGQGFAILSYDQRASGESAGESLTWGWLDARDLAGAVDYLLTRPEIDPQRIGVLGCSTGAEIAINGAALDQRIAAVIADAPYYSTASDISLDTWEEWLGLPMYSLFIQLMKWRTGIAPDITLEEAVARLSPRPLLLISAGQDFEYHQAQHFYALAGQPKEHWNIPEAQHCAGPRVRPEEYERRIVTFFESYLRSSGR